MDRRLQAASLPGLSCCFACLVGDRTDAKALPTEPEHFWHKGHSIYASVLIQSRQDFLLAADFHKIASAETR
jgi:hypothetical protein